MSWKTLILLLIPFAVSILSAAFGLQVGSTREEKKKYWKRIWKRKSSLIWLGVAIVVSSIGQFLLSDFVGEEKERAARRELLDDLSEALKKDKLRYDSTSRRIVELIDSIDIIQTKETVIKHELKPVDVDFCQQAITVQKENKDSIEFSIHLCPQHAIAYDVNLELKLMFKFIDGSFSGVKKRNILKTDKLNPYPIVDRKNSITNRRAPVEIMFMLLVGSFKDEDGKQRNVKSFLSYHFSSKSIGIPKRVDPEIENVYQTMSNK